MSRKRKNKSAPEQLSLEDLAGFWEQPTTPRYEAPQSPGGRISAREASTSYQVTPIAGPGSQPLDQHQNRQLIVPVNQTPPTNQIIVPVGITFDPCQGIREVRQGWTYKQVPSEVVFDARHLELASEYTCQPKPDKLFSPKQEYLLGRGGLVNIATFMNLLRCYDTVDKWSQDKQKETGDRPISSFQFIPPAPNTPVGKLWQVLGMPGLPKKPPQNLWKSGVMEFQSRIVTPLLWVNSNNRNDINIDVSDWLLYIREAGRINHQTFSHLCALSCEVVTNLIDHGHRGVFGLAIWPSGQIELLWSNPIDHLVDSWPPEDDPISLANSLLSSQGAGMPYIYDTLLPQYKGGLVINWKTHNLIFTSGGEFQVMGFKPRNDFYPISIMFHLHLFSPETRNRSEKNAPN